MLLSFQQLSEWCGAKTPRGVRSWAQKYNVHLFKDVKEKPITTLAEIERAIASRRDNGKKPQPEKIKRRVKS